jgi:hypothetical protein
MNRIRCGMALAISLVGWRGLSAQSKSSRVMAEITGASWKWILAAEPEFQRENVGLGQVRGLGRGARRFDNRRTAIIHSTVLKGQGEAWEAIRDTRWKSARRI